MEWGKKSSEYCCCRHKLCNHYEQPPCIKYLWKAQEIQKCYLYVSVCYRKALSILAGNLYKLALQFCSNFLIYMFFENAQEVTVTWWMLLAASSEKKKKQDCPKWTKNILVFQSESLGCTNFSYNLIKNFASYFCHFFGSSLLCLRIYAVAELSWRLRW